MKLWVKILLIFLCALVLIINMIFIPIGLPLAWIPIILDALIVLSIIVFAFWACFKVGSNSERRDR